MAVSALARDDLRDIADYVREADSPGAAAAVARGIAKTIRELAILPGRGSVPRELEHLGRAGACRQVFFHSYRIFYTFDETGGAGAIGAEVEVFLVADGRRDMDQVLAARLAAGR